MALAVHQTAHQAPGSGSTTTSATLPGASAVGNLLVAICNGYDGVPAPGSVSDSKGNVWTRNYATAGGPGEIWIAIYSTVLTVAGTAHTVTFSQTGIAITNLDIAEVSGALASGAFDVVVQNGGVSVAPWTTGPTGTLGQSDEIVFASLSVDTGEIATITEDPTWTLIGENESGVSDVSSVVYKIVATNASVQHSWNATFTSSKWLAVAASYKATAVQPTGTVAVTAAPDVAVLAGSFTAPSGGVISVTEANDVAQISGNVVAGIIDGGVAVVEANDTGSIVGLITNPPPLFKYPVAVSGRKFLDQTGAVWLCKDVSSWGMTQYLTNAEITEALEGIAARHFNCILSCIGGMNMTGTSPSQFQNVSGQNYFVGTPWASALGPAWARIDWYVSECTRLGLVAGLSMWMSFADSGNMDSLSTDKTAGIYQVGKDIATRYASYPNLIWHVMGDTAWGWNWQGANLDALFHGFRDGEGAVPHLIIAEPARPNTSYTQFISQQADHGTVPGYSWFKCSANTLYSYNANAVEEFDAVYNQGTAPATLPVWDCEPGYVGAHRYSSTDSIDRQNIRERTLADLIRGGIGINWGHEAWWTFDRIFTGISTQWRDVPSSVEAFEAQYAWDLADAYCADPAWAPDNSAVSTGLGSGDTKAAVGTRGSALLAYFPTARAVTVNTTTITGTGNVQLRWWDPTTGNFGVISANEAQNAARSITYPANHPDGTSDYVLVVELADSIAGSIGMVETPDTASIVGTVTAGPTTGIVAVSEAFDTGNIVGLFTGVVIGVIAGVEVTDQAVIVGTLPDTPDAPTGALTVTVSSVIPPLRVTPTER